MSEQAQEETGWHPVSKDGWFCEAEDCPTPSEMNGVWNRPYAGTSITASVYYLCDPCYQKMIQEQEKELHD